MKEKLKQKIEALGLTVTDGDLEKFEAFYRYLLEENEKFNLTNITAEDGVIDKHFVDSLAGVRFLGNEGTVIDVGSGAGFPGIPLAIVCRKHKFTLADSLSKRVNFLNAAIEKLGITNAVAVHTRAEDFGRLKTREAFKVAVARAVAPLNTLCEYCLPLVSVGGIFLAYKANLQTALDGTQGGTSATPFSASDSFLARASESVEKHEEGDELAAAKNAIAVLGGKLREVCSFTLPDTDINRSVVVIDKVAKTPDKYPRGKNKEKTNPL